MIQSKGIFIIFDALFNAGRFSIGDHEDLFVGIFSPPQNIHCQFQASNGIRMIRTNLKVGKVFDFNLPGIITKY